MNKNIRKSSIKRHLILIVCLSICALATDSILAQSLKITPNKALYVLPAVDNARMQLKENSKRKPGRANEFAIPMKVDITPGKDGIWKLGKNGEAIWYMDILSEGAHSLNLGFTAYELPAQTDLMIISQQSGEQHGPFTKADNESHQQLWTPIIAGDRLRLQLHTLRDKIDDIHLVLSYVNHDYMDVAKSLKSGSCNLDVSCGSDDGWDIIEPYRDQIQSVGAYTLNGFAQCSGALINNTSNDCTPYFLTANHCSVTPSSAASMVVYWNYQQSDCRQPGSLASGQAGDGSLSTFNSGVIHRASFAETDMTLVELEDPLNELANGYLSGWNRSALLPDTSICIHHPGVEEKRISFNYDPVVRENDQDFYIEVDNWEVGTTEGGSSGSPLFNSAGQIIGQLFGGNAACGNTLEDSYGWIRRSWDGGGAPSSSLSPWLDPSGLGLMEIPGKACQFFATLSSTSFEYCVSETDMRSFDITLPRNFESNASLTIISLPNDAVLTFSNDDPAPNETITATLSNLSQLPNGVSRVIIDAADQDGNSTTIEYILQTVSGTPSAPLLVFPSDDAQDVSSRARLRWQKQSLEYELEVATDDSFMNVVEAASEIDGNEYQVNLDSNQEYHWRVRSRNICGASDWSASRSFTIGDESCETASAFDLPQSLVDFRADTIVSEIFFASSGIISDINVINVRGTHTWISDLTFVLEAPAGQRVTLMVQPCLDEDDYEISFDDEATSSTVQCPVNQGQIVRPVNSLDVLLGTEAQGLWKLFIFDDFTQDAGALLNWELEICADYSGDYSLSPSESDIMICDEHSISVDLFLGSSFADDYTISLDDVAPDALMLSTTTNPDGSDRLEISGFGDLEPGIIALNIVVADNENSNMTQILVTKNEEPDAAILEGPANDAINVTVVDTEFSWLPSALTTGYTIEVDTSDDFSDPVIVADIKEAIYQSNVLLEKEILYYWRVTSINDCGDSISEVYSFTTEMISTVADLPDGGRLDIFPNPADDHVNVSLVDTNVALDEISLYSIDGRLIWQSNLNGQSEIVQTAFLSSGIYFLAIRVDGQRYVDRLLISH